MHQNSRKILFPIARPCDKEKRAIAMWNAIAVRKATVKNNEPTVWTAHLNMQEMYVKYGAPFTEVLISEYYANTPDV